MVQNEQNNNSKQKRRNTTKRNKTKMKQFKFGKLGKNIATATMSVATVLALIVLYSLWIKYACCYTFAENVWWMCLKMAKSSKCWRTLLAEWLSENVRFGVEKLFFIIYTDGLVSHSNTHWYWITCSVQFVVSCFLTHLRYLCILLICFPLCLQHTVNTRWFPYIHQRAENNLGRIWIHSFLWFRLQVVRLNQH